MVNIYRIVLELAPKSDVTLVSNGSHVACHESRNLNKKYNFRDQYKFDCY